MQVLNTYDYAVIRVVPRVDRGEFVNVGVLISSANLGVLKCRIEMSEDKVRALAADVDLEPIRAILEAIPKICAGGAAAGDLGKLSRGERFHWLVAPRSSSVQMSPVHMGRAQDIDSALEQIFKKMVAG